MTKKRVIILGVIISMITSAGVFYACKKDNENAILGNKEQKVMGSIMGIEDLRELEYYTPEAEGLSDKLLQFANYVNKPTADNPMPNMEIKEAIWFMETFFNIGVCEKQKQFVDYTHSKKSYYITIPLVNGTGTGWNPIVINPDVPGNPEVPNGEGIYLKGSMLQSQYRNLLRTIVTEICPEYALNFGDVYVKSITAAGVTLGIDVMYGQKCDHEYEGRYKIIEPTQGAWFPFNYPDPGVFMLSAFYGIGKGPDPWLDIPYSGMLGYLRDPYMEYTLNRNFTQREVINIIHCQNERMSPFTLSPLGQSNNLACTGSGAALGSCNCIQVIHKHANGLDGCSFWDRVYSTITIPAKPATPLLTKSEYESFGNLYKNYIYANLCNNIPQGYEPLYAACFHGWDRGLSLGNYAVASWQHFGVEYIVKFVEKEGDPYRLELCIHMLIFKDPLVAPYLLQVTQ